MKKRLLMFTIIVLLAFSATAQKTYTWDYYHIQISTPLDFKVTKNTDHDFDLKGDGMELSMHIFDKDIAIEELDNATIEGAKAMKLTEIDEETQVNVNELEGYFVEGLKDGNRVVFAGLKNLKNRTNFFIVMVFEKEDNEAEKAAIDIIDNLDVITNKNF